MKIPVWFSGLRQQIVMLLTLALLPVGAIAVYQTARVEATSNRNAQLALLALTGRAAKSEELILERAFGAARVLATMAPELVDDPERCNLELTRFQATNPQYTVVGILPISGMMTCSSAGREFDFSSLPIFNQIFATDERSVTVNERGPLSGQSVFIVSEPYEIDGAFAGMITVSIPHIGMPGSNDDLDELGLVDLMTFNSDGDILTSRAEDREAAVIEIPASHTLVSLDSRRGQAFQGVNQNGVSRIYTVAPIEGSSVRVIGVWAMNNGLSDRLGSFLTPAIFPLLMWIASMAVAMLSIHTLVTRHITRLRRRMDVFARTRTTDNVANTVSMPTEIQALSLHFDSMTDAILREEAALEDALREKNVLIKEVHHRVKNNLQLISSIMNMKIRLAKHEETKTILSRLQDRVLSLATIHRDLYQTENGGQVDVGALITEIVDKSIEVASGVKIDVETDIEKVLLYPDQAVPLSLLTAEGMTNAMKYMSGTSGKKPWVKVTLKQDGARCELRLSNSTGVQMDAESTGLGAQLIKAFSIQLGGKMELDETPDSYTISLNFEIEDFKPELRDF